MAEIVNEYQILVERKAAGDKLDSLAAELAAREGCRYSEAFQRISVLNPELVKKYNSGE
ncbi:MAG: hypothetical protein ABH891_00030 [Candidatus Omnitrophota bacterium]